MKTFQQFLCEINGIDIESIKNIIFNALGISGSKINDPEYLQNNLGDFDTRKKILDSQLIRTMPNFGTIKKIVSIDYKKYTLGLLANKILELNSVTSPGD